LQLQDNIWIYARANSSDTLDAPGASLKYEFKKGPPVRVGLSVQQGQYDRQYNMEQTYGPVHSYEFTHATVAGRAPNNPLKLFARRFL